MYDVKYHNTDISKSTFLVTGGAGFIGSNIVEYLLKFGVGKVRVLDNFSTGKFENIKDYLGDPRFELVEGDIRDLQTCRDSVRGVDYVFHEAALGSVPRSIDDPVTTNAVNITGFLNMLVASENEKAKFVYAASSSTYGDSKELPKVEARIGNPLSPYAVTKYVNELYADVFSRVYKFNATGLRYFNVFGPRQNPTGAYAAVIPLFIDCALKDENPVINGDGNTSRDFTYIENVVQANILAMLGRDATSYEVFNVACGNSVTLNQLWDTISIYTGTAAVANYREERKGDVRHSLADISKAQNLLGYRPSVSVNDGLQLSIQWYMQNIQHLQTA
jgi:UDP-N-acetylglucosamine 4-epimerase